MGQSLGPGVYNPFFPYGFGQMTLVRNPTNAEKMSVVIAEVSLQAARTDPALGIQIRCSKSFR